MNFNVTAIKRRYESFVEDILREVVELGARLGAETTSIHAATPRRG